MRLTCYSGHEIDLLNPTARDINLADIAHSLSMQARFNGHTREFYSVAQHSVLVSEYVDELGGSSKDRRSALMHDAHEAYMGDIIGPIKKFAPVERGIRTIEAALDCAIYDKFNLNTNSARRALIKRADMVLLVTEARDLLNGDNDRWFPELPRWDRKIVAMSQQAAELQFLDRFRQLFNLETDFREIKDQGPNPQQRTAESEKKTLAPDTVDSTSGEPTEETS